MSDFQVRSSASTSRDVVEQRIELKKQAVKLQQRMRIRISHFLAVFIVAVWVVLSFLTRESVGSEVIVVCMILSFALLVELQNFDAFKNSRINQPKK